MNKLPGFTAESTAALYFSPYSRVRRPQKAPLDSVEPQWGGWCLGAVAFGKYAVIFQPETAVHVGLGVALVCAADYLTG
jgi:hypothetical protein